MLDTKDILKMATNGDIMYYLDEIKALHDQIGNKPQTEVKSEFLRIQKMLGYIQEIMEEI